MALSFWKNIKNWKNGERKRKQRSQNLPCKKKWLSEKKFPGLKTRRIWRVLDLNNFVVMVTCRSGCWLVQEDRFCVDQKKKKSLEIQTQKHKLCIVFQKLDGFVTALISAFRIRTQNLSIVFTFFRGVQYVKNCHFPKIVKKLRSTGC